MQNVVQKREKKRRINGGAMRGGGIMGGGGDGSKTRLRHAAVVTSAPKVTEVKGRRLLTSAAAADSRRCWLFLPSAADSRFCSHDALLAGIIAVVRFLGHPVDSRCWWLMLFLLIRTFAGFCCLLLSLSEALLTPC